MKTSTGWIIGGSIVSVVAITGIIIYFNKQSGNKGITLDLKPEKLSTGTGNASYKDAVGTVYTLVKDFKALNEKTVKNVDFKAGEKFTKKIDRNGTSFNNVSALIVEGNGGSYVIPESLLSTKSKSTSTPTASTTKANSALPSIAEMKKFIAANSGEGKDVTQLDRVKLSDKEVKMLYILTKYPDAQPKSKEEGLAIMSKQIGEKVSMADVEKMYAKLLADSSLSADGERDAHDSAFNYAEGVTQSFPFKAIFKGTPHGTALTVSNIWTINKGEIIIVTGAFSHAGGGFYIRNSTNGNISGRLHSSIFNRDFEIISRPLRVRRPLVFNPASIVMRGG